MKNSFVESPFKILLLYRKNSEPLESFYEYLRYFIERSTAHFVIGDFNVDGFTDNVQLQNIFSEYTQVVKEPTHLSGSLLDHIYVRNTVLQEFYISTSVINLYFSDHDAIRLKLQKRMLTLTSLLNKV